MAGRSLKGVVLAGGEGTRFRPLTYYFQKCMIPVGDEQKPVLEYIIRLFRHHEICDVILLVGYKHQQVKNYFDDGTRFGVNLEYVLDEPELKGNANALLNAYRQGILSKDDCMIIIYGDILSDIDLREMVSQHLDARAAATVALSQGFKIRVGTAEIKNGLITRFIEKPEMDQPVSVGILVLSGLVLEEMEQIHAEGHPKHLDLMGNLIPHLIERGLPVLSYITDAFWYDLGSYERYERFENEGLSDKLSFLTETG